MAIPKEIDFGLRIDNREAELWALDIPVEEIDINLLKDNLDIPYLEKEVTMLLGFSTGCLYKTHNPLSPSTINIFRELGCNAIEIMFHNAWEVDEFLSLEKEDLKCFEFISVHAPIYKKESHNEYLEALKAIEINHNKIGFDSVVLHPDMFEKFSLFKEFNLPFMVENMDNRKTSCKNAEDLKKVFQQFDVPMVLDVNHCFSNDSTMKLAGELMDAFEDRVLEIHLSGFTTFHDPLFETKQSIILDAVPKKNLPIINESVIVSLEDLEKEYEYMKGYFGI